MLRTRSLSLLPLLCTLALLAACDDPSNVGIGLVDEQGNPEVRTLPATVFAEEPLKDLTGLRQRILAGRVNDPMLGTLAATGYVDFQTTFDTTGAPVITGVALRLAPDYVYGDTSVAMTLNLYDLVEDWDANGAPADTVLPRGALIRSFDFLPGDTLVTVDLPETWVSANDTTLRSRTFESSFHGFALEAQAGDAVVGFDAGNSALRVFTDADTLDYPLTRTLSGLERTGSPNLPPNRILVQDGLGPTVRFNFDFKADALKETPLNGAIVRLFADTTSVLDAPPNFVRPAIERLQLVGVDADSSSFALAEAALTPEGYYRFSAPLGVNVLSLQQLVQRTLFGEEVYDHFELRIPFEATSGLPTDNNTLNVMLLYDAASAGKAPEALLTLSPSGT